MKKDWKKYPPHFTHPTSDCFWQKGFYHKNDIEIHANITQYTHSDGSIGFELEIQIPSELSITGKTINTTNFSYNKLDFNLIEKHAKKTINALINN